MADFVLKDQKARDDVVGELDRCLLVEAGAGSGKTYSMVQRMVALVREGKCAVENMAAVTFTRKAAAELKERFQLVLEKEFTREIDGDKKERLEKALHGLDRCFLGTIHSFCAALLRERPIEAGLDPGFRELDELEDVFLQNKIWEDYLNDVRANSPQLLEVLANVDIDPGELRASFKKLLIYPDVEMVSKTTEPPNLNEARPALDSLLENLAGLMPNTVPIGGWDSLQRMIRMILRRKRVLDFNDDLILLRLFADLDKTGSVVQKRWVCKEDALHARETFDSFRASYISPVLQTWREHRYSKVLRFILPAVRLYNQRKKEQSRLNFQDLLIHTAALLRENPQVRRYFQGRYTHLLIDEFQDTDPVQAEIMFYLTGRDTTEKKWYRLTPKPGSLFVVGDPKQSIYRFRRADIDTYNLAKQLLLAGGGRILHFTTNFRSVEAVGDFANRVFKDIFPGQATPRQAAFAEMDTLHDNEKGRSFGIKKIHIPKQYRNRQLDIVKVDAAKIAWFIRRALDGEILLSRTDDELKAGLTERPVPADFMIILRYKANMEEYARELERQGIPFQIAGGGGFAQSEEMDELLKILKALLDPDNPVDLVAALRGGFYGVSDRQLWLFKKAGGRFNFLAEVPDSLDGAEGDLFGWAFGQLRRFSRWTRELPASAAFESIISELGVIPFAFTGELGKSRSGYLMQGLELLAEAERGGVTAFNELVGYLELLKGAGVEEELNIAPWELNAVRLMNLHKAKGLEAPVVFLANPGKKTNIPPDMHISRVGDTPKGYFTVAKQLTYTSEILAQPLDWDKYAGIEQEYLDAEELRLLYVAATRAKNMLVVSTYPSAPGKSPWGRLDGALKHVEELGRGDKALEESPDTCEIKGGDKTEAPGSTLASELDLARKSFLSRDSRINAPTYHVAAVTDLSKGGAGHPGRIRTRHGMSWGRVV
ncbi:MAG TPA: UvrD-helicase domain-containing protein, partial [Clostridia bacterium]|nr:UvrD-helicase domain-containing protein [Clostridia bacterium]